MWETQETHRRVSIVMGDKHTAVGATTMDEAPQAFITELEVEYALGDAAE